MMYCYVVCLYIIKILIILKVSVENNLTRKHIMKIGATTVEVLCCVFPVQCFTFLSVLMPLHDRVALFTTSSLSNVFQMLYSTYIYVQ